MEKWKIKILIEKDKDIVWGVCMVNGNLITDWGGHENTMKYHMKNTIFEFEGISPHLIEFEEEYI